MLLVSTFTSNQTNAPLVAGVPGKRILVVRVQASFETLGSLKLISDPGGASQADLTPPIYLAAYGGIDLEPGADGGLATGVGVGLGLTTALGGPSRGHGVMIWYEVVPS